MEFWNRFPAGTLEFSPDFLWRVPLTVVGKVILSGAEAWDLSSINMVTLQLSRWIFTCWGLLWILIFSPFVFFFFSWNKKCYLPFLKEFCQINLIWLSDLLIRNKWREGFLENIWLNATCASLKKLALVYLKKWVAGWSQSWLINVKADVKHENTIWWGQYQCFSAKTVSWTNQSRTK